MAYINWLKPLPTHREHRPGWGLSQSGNCIRQLALYDLNFIPEPIDAKTQRIFKMGDHVEELVTDELRNRQANLQDQQKLVTWLGRRGRIDGTIEIFERVMLEVKSMNSRAFAICKREGVEAAYPHYFAQVVSYLRGWNKDYPDKLRYCLFVALDKGTSEIYEELLELDWKVELALENKIKYLDYWVDIIKKHRGCYKTVQGVLDDLILAFPVPKTWKCSYCGFKKLCYPPKRRRKK